MNYNKVILVGNLTRDPQMSYLPSQTAVVDFGMAVNRKWKDQAGQQKEEVCFIDMRAFGKSAEILNQYTSKGAPLLVEGRLVFDQWQGKDGQKHSKHRVVVEKFQFMGQGEARTEKEPEAYGQRAEREEPAPDYDTDIPF